MSKNQNTINAIITNPLTADEYRKNAISYAEQAKTATDEKESKMYKELAEKSEKTALVLDTQQMKGLSANVFNAKNVKTGADLLALYELKDGLNNTIELVLCRVFHNLKTTGAWVDIIESKDFKSVTTFEQAINKYLKECGRATMENYCLIGQYLDDNGEIVGLHRLPEDNGVSYTYQQLLDIIRLCRKGIESKKKADILKKSQERLQALAKMGYIRPIYKTKNILENKIRTGILELEGIDITKKVETKTETKPTESKTETKPTESKTETETKPTESKTETETKPTERQQAYQAVIELAKRLMNLGLTADEESTATQALETLTELLRVNE